MSEYMAAARSPPRSLPANNHDFLPSYTSQRPLGGVVREADPAVVQEPREGLPAGQHVVHGLGDRAVAGQLAAALAHPGFEFGDERRDVLLADSQARLSGQAVDGT